MTPEDLDAVEVRADSAQFIIARISLPPALRESLRKSAADVPALVVTLREVQAENATVSRMLGNVPDIAGMGGSWAQRVLGEWESMRAERDAAGVERDEALAEVERLRVMGEEQSRLIQRLDESDTQRGQAIAEVRALCVESKHREGFALPWVHVSDVYRIIDAPRDPDTLAGGS